ncbi:MAG: chemotaxis protein CheW, partial [Pseudomonadota bacterium]
VIQLGNAFIGIPIEHLSEVFHIQKGEAIAQRGELLQGGIALRGRLVPVLNLQLMGGLHDVESTAKLGVILEHAQRLLAIFVDNIVGIATVAHNDMDGIKNGKSADQSLFKSLFAYQGRFVSILDVAHMFSAPDVYTAQRPNITKRSKLRTQEPVLKFEAGAALYSVPAVEVYAAIPRQTIAHTAITMGDCLGEITYHGRRIPVVCPFRILGLGNRRRPALTEIVALRFPDNLVLGFAVDAIHEIGTFSGAKDTTVPLWQAGRNFIERVIIRDDEEQIYAISLDRLHKAEDLQAIASLSKVTDERKKKPKPQISENRNVSRKKERYIVIDAEDRLAVPLSQVNRIVEPPKRLTTADAQIPGFRGYFSRFDESIALFDLAECRGQGAVDDGHGKILLTGRPGHQVGFLVERVVSIEMSEWCEKPTENNARQDTTLVQLGDGSNATVLPALDLLQVVDQESVELA